MHKYREKVFQDSFLYNRLYLIFIYNITLCSALWNEYQHFFILSVNSWDAFKYYGTLTLVFDSLKKFSFFGLCPLSNCLIKHDVSETGSASDLLDPSESSVTRHYALINLPRNEHEDWTCPRSVTEKCRFMVCPIPLMSLLVNFSYLITTFLLLEQDLLSAEYFNKFTALWCPVREKGCI